MLTNLLQDLWWSPGKLVLTGQVENSAKGNLVMNSSLNFKILGITSSLSSNIAISFGLFIAYLSPTGLFTANRGWKIFSQIYSQVLSPSRPYQALTIFDNKRNTLDFKTFTF